jgi:GWxTD domain-containing protein
MILDKIKIAFVFGAVVFLAGCAATEKIVLDPESRDFYETARLVMTDAEKDIFNHLPDTESRREFIKDFWTKRDPDLDTESNEFKVEFESRLDYANKHFKEGRRGWNTDRGRIYVYLGPPEKAEEYFPSPGEGIRGSIIWWIYYRHDLGIEFVDEKGTGAYTISQITGDLFGAMEAAKLGAVYQSEGGPTSHYTDFDLAYDKGKKEIILSIPVKRLSLRDESGQPKADFEFEFFIYKRGGAHKQTMKGSRTFQSTEQDLENMKDISFTFAYDLSPGKNFIDVIVIGKAIGRSRKIFTVKN